ncbi:Uncharacterized conserved protein, contains HEPN domain [Tistlia consotensis]|uniref:Uncharacterized conserved protein, contains HEPN domain n=1 Tax=Tistlia consotensis USBA 355 TaxID=560819 RepID=A0A1Y6CS17_9PROT|nr:HepT-like ribonuclease domain-containing protein [Tistlia consotensis]SMF84495.1 Uncharacterized conserved protein, contains HEPN domain [Tistlia consotensis USBA 355]SNS36423.1 Uncharacterized conserved protein, contains HEPN domain [Tistlia consotensis]
MNERDLVRLGHMLHAAREATRLIGSGTPDAALGDPARRHGLIYLIQVIGEAGSNVSDESRNRLPAVAWTAIVGMRHRLVHGYFQIRDDVLAETVRHDLPELIAILEPHVPEEYIGPL